MIEPDGGQAFSVLTTLARHVEQRGFDGLYVSDHYEPAFDWFDDGAPDSWVLLAGLATSTSTIALGTLVTPVTLRRVITLAKAVSTVAWMTDSGAAFDSRIHLGLGAGWLESEHEHYGLPFGAPAERFDRLEEHLEAINQLWDPSQRHTTVVGDHVAIRDAVFAPKPSPRPRILLGGRGRRRMPKLAARYADELNVPYLPNEELGNHKRLLADACHEVGRDPKTLAFSAKRGVLTGRTTDDVIERARRMKTTASDDRSVDDYLAWLGQRWLVGTGEQVAGQIDALGEAGVEHIVLQHLLPDDLDMVDVIADSLGVKRPSIASAPLDGHP